MELYCLNVKTNVWCSQKKEKHMYAVTKDILKQINSLEVQMTDLGKHRNQICISVPILTGSFLLKFFKKDFHKQYPDISLSPVSSLPESS